MSRSGDNGVFWTRGRIIRWVILLTVGVVAIVICWHDPVYAGPAASGQSALGQAASVPSALGQAASVPSALARVADGAVLSGAVDATAPRVRLAEVDTPAAGHASVTALLIGAGLVALLFAAITLVTFRRR